VNKILAIGIKAIKIPRFTKARKIESEAALFPCLILAYRKSIKINEIKNTAIYASFPLRGVIATITIEAITDKAKNEKVVAL
jgi:hypothetical protein